MESDSQETDYHRVTDPSYEDPPRSATASSPSQHESLKVKCHHNGSLPPPQNPTRAKQTAQSQPLPTLPEELIMEILSRLPVKSLLRFRCVCKSIKTLISNPKFIKTHLNKITNDSEKVLLIPTDPELSLKSCSLYSIYNSPRTDDVELDYYLLKDKRCVDWIFASWDGLLAMVVQEDYVVLWNPSTRVFRRLPDLGFKKKLRACTVYGFGYDGSIDDYKVVAMYSFPNKVVNGVTRYETRVKVCTLRTNYWKRIEDFRYGAPYDEFGMYVNGCLCWSAIPESGSMWIIVSFDLVEETYKEVMQPDYGEVSSDMAIGILDARLCVMCDYVGVRTDLWVMQQFGVRESWTKVVSIPYFDDPVRCQWLVPLCLSGSGEVLLESSSSLVIYNPKDGTFRCPVINGTRSCNCLNGLVYNESLVSPNVES